MNRTVKRMVARLMRNRWAWLAVRAPLDAAAAARLKLEQWRDWDEAAVERDRAARERFAAKCGTAFAALTVLNGPFKGMRYPALRSAGSTVYPKLLGSYERELHGVVEAAVGRGYDAVVDVGCAEGYYAVGLGMRRPGARVFAYDTDPGALALCREMAALNGVRVETGEFCDAEYLTGLDLGRRALVVSDCEGYETQLFSRETVARLRRHDFLVETHDFIDLEATQRVLAAFEPTHDCELIESVDDIIKAYTYEYAELRDFELPERLRAVREGRPAIMRWVSATPRADGGA